MKSYLNLKSFSTKRTPESIIKKVDKLSIKTVTMGFPDIYGRFIGKKYDVDYFLNNVLTKGSNACNYLLGCDMKFVPLPNTKLSSYDLGYGDFVMKTDIDSMREVNYINGDTQLLFFADLAYIEEENKKVEYAPRQLLRQALKELKEKHNIKVTADCEINFTAFHEKYRKSMNDIKSMKPITEHSNLANVFYSQAYEKLLASINSSMKFSNIPVNGIYGDSGKGQFKICLDLTEPIEFADNITLLKLVSIF